MHVKNGPPGQDMTSDQFWSAPAPAPAPIKIGPRNVESMHALKPAKFIKECRPAAVLR